MRKALSVALVTVLMLCVGYSAVAEEEGGAVIPVTIRYQTPISEPGEPLVMTVLTATKMAPWSREEDGLTFIRVLLAEGFYDKPKKRYVPGRMILAVDPVVPTGMAPTYGRRERDEDGR